MQQPAAKLWSLKAPTRPAPDRAVVSCIYAQNQDARPRVTTINSFVIDHVDHNRHSSYCQGLPALTTFVRPLIALAGLAAAITPAFADGEHRLRDLTKTIERDYGTVSSISREDFILFRTRTDIVIFDVREETEFNVSHVPGAVHIAPKTTAKELALKFGNDLPGKMVVVYCSVGIRSSKFAQRLETDVRRLGGKGIVNLKGGVFGWHNYALPLIGSHSPTDAVHGYSRAWSRYLDFDNLAVYPPTRTFWRP
jgi:rhodanese-related sulfurtransferase